MADNDQKRSLPPHAIPAVGTCLTVLSALSMLVVCMLLPMVGAAGSSTSFAQQNRSTFALYVLLSLLLSVAAIVSKMARRAVDGSPRPISSFVLCALNVVVLLALFSGLLSI